MYVSLSVMIGILSGKFKLFEIFIQVAFGWDESCVKKFISGTQMLSVSGMIGLLKCRTVRVT